MKLFWWWPFGKVPEISAKQLSVELQNATRTPLVLDVRTVAEWNDHRIAGSINVPITELGSRIAALAWDRKRPIVAVCRSARRSIPAVRLLARNGYLRVCQLEGGMLAWGAAGLPVEQGQSPLKG